MCQRTNTKTGYFSAIANVIRNCRHRFAFYYGVYYGILDYGNPEKFSGDQRKQEPHTTATAIAHNDILLGGHDKRTFHIGGGKRKSLEYAHLSIDD